MYRSHLCLGMTIVFLSDDICQKQNSPEMVIIHVLFDLKGYIDFYIFFIL